MIESKKASKSNLACSPYWHFYYDHKPRIRQTPPHIHPRCPRCSPPSPPPRMAGSSRVVPRLAWNESQKPRRAASRHLLSPHYFGLATPRQALCLRPPQAPAPGNIKYHVSCPFCWCWWGSPGSISACIFISLEGPSKGLADGRHAMVKPLAPLPAPPPGPPFPSSHPPTLSFI